MASLADLQSYARKERRTIFELAARILTGRPDIRDQAISLRKPDRRRRSRTCWRCCRSHAARHQLICSAGSASTLSRGAQTMFSRCARRRRCARCSRNFARAAAGISAHVGAAGPELPTNAKPAFLSLAPLWPWLLDMERPGYDPFRPPQVALWRRQWRIWRAAKAFRAHRRVADYSAAAAGISPAIHCRDRRARAGSVRSCAPAPWRCRGPVCCCGRMSAASRSGGNRPKLTFIGWNDDGPASMVSIWPPVICASSAPCAVVARRRHNPSRRGARRRRSVRPADRRPRIQHSPRSR